MTVESSNNKSGPFIASGATGVFPRNFLVFDPAHVRVVRSRDGVETDITTGIAHSGMGSASGTVTLTQGIRVTGDDAPEQIEARFAEISDREGEIVPDMGAAQGMIELTKARTAHGA